MVNSKRAGLLDLVLHVVLRQAELAEDEGRRLVEDDGALEREHHVLGGDRVAGGELLARRILKVKVLPSGETVQDSATSPEIFDTSLMS